MWYLLVGSRLSPYHLATAAAAGDFFQEQNPMISATIKPFDIATHNGCITITSVRTGHHRTIEIKTSKSGVRWVSMLTGPDNERSYQSFGRIESDGTRAWVAVFYRYRYSNFFMRLATILEEPERFTDRCEFQFEGRCRICNRKLTNPASIRSGIGPECAKR